MVGDRLHVHARQGVHHPGYRRLPCPRIRPHRLLRGRYRRTADLDGAAHRDRRDGAAADCARPTGRPGPEYAAHGAAAARERPAMRRQRRTKIVATLGPASSDRAVIAALFRAGADVFRINMSHTTHDRMRELVRTIRDIEQEFGRPIGILVDLQGPKLRVGAFKDDAVQLVAGAEFVLDSDPAPGDVTRVYLPHPEILSGLKPGHALL